ncbi:hypothetical protein [Hyphomonas sp.]|uniref:hypothetical protein n=1 Tax=Hyphomonas sp. TaxID=87 RepID=UPI0025BE5B24|nr:hypothetical protein [Hyphomonas sp.]
MNTGIAYSKINFQNRLGVDEALSWDQIEERVAQNEQEFSNPLRMELVEILKGTAGIVPDPLSGQDKKIIFIRLGGNNGALLAIEISGKTGLTCWCEAQFESAIQSAGLVPQLKPYKKQPGTNNTGRHSGLDRKNRFEPVTLVNTKVKSAADIRSIITAIMRPEFDWAEFWGGFLGAMGEVDVTPSRTDTLLLSQKGGVRLELRTNTGSNMLHVTLSISGEGASGRYNHLRSILPQIEGRFGTELSWRGCPSSGI